MTAPITLDLPSAAALVRRRWKRLAFGVLLGAAVGVGILLFVPPWFTGSGMLLIRMEQPDASSAIMDKLASGGGGAMSSLMPGLLGGGGDEQLATELALLQSRAVLGAVSDSLQLQVIPKSPGRTPSAVLVDSLRLPELFKPFTLTLDSAVTHTHGGAIYATRAGVGARVKLMDRGDAIDDMVKRLSVSKTGGDAVTITYRARDSVTAARIPNLMTAVYMVRRKTVDRGLNARRLEFLEAKADTVRRDLDRAADKLATVAEHNGAGASADIAAKAIADQIGTVEAQISQFRAAERALDSLIRSVRAHTLDARALAGFPDLLKSPALNDLITQLAKIQTEHTMLLAQAPETSPQAIALNAARDSLTAQLMPIASAFQQALIRQERSLERDRDSLSAELQKLPAKAAAVGKQQAEVTQLAQLNMGMGAQVLQARLAAMREGGLVQLVDSAEVQRREAFPRPLITMLVSLVAGLVVGILLLPIGGVPHDGAGSGSLPAARGE